MNIKNLVAAFAILSATFPVLAQQTEWIDPAVQLLSGETRSEGIAEVKQARADRVHVTNDRDPVQVAPSGRARTRAEVRAEIARSVKKHHGETSDPYFGS